MFQAEESLQHLQALRYQVIAMKDGESVEELPTLEVKKLKENYMLSQNKKQKEINE